MCDVVNGYSARCSASTDQMTFTDGVAPEASLRPRHDSDTRNTYRLGGAGVGAGAAADAGAGFGR